jgi:hypothetical protein
MTAAGVVTVADLLNRNPPVPVRIEPVDDTGHGISVGSLLRREGRAPHAVDRPVQPRPHQQPAEEPEKPVADRLAMVRRGAVTAGALLAAGSVLGAAFLTEMGPTAATVQDPPADGPYPGQGLLDPGAGNSLVPSAGTVQLDQAASVNALDPGAPAPTSWVSVAFPGALAGGSAGTSAAAAADAVAEQATGGGTGGTGNGGTNARAESGGSGSGGAGASDDSSASSRGGDTGSSSGGGNSGGSDDNGGSGGGNEQQGVVGDLGDGVGGAANGLGDAVGGPVGGAVGDLGDTVDDTAGGVDNAVGGLLNRDNDRDNGNDRKESGDDRRSARASSSDDDSSSSSAPRHEGSSDDGDRGSGGSSGGLLGTVGDLAGGLLG